MEALVSFWHWSTSRGYHEITSKWMRIADAPAVCGTLEDEHADGYAVFAQVNGRQVADADGLTEYDPPSRYERQCASFGETE